MPTLGTYERLAKPSLARITLIEAVGARDVAALCRLANWCRHASETDDTPARRSAWNALAMDVEKKIVAMNWLGYRFDRPPPFKEDGEYRPDWVAREMASWR